jgi:glycosyltransferase involved in cell wall biosynthesis
MNILISIGSLGLGGAEKQAVWLANEFAIDNEVTLITYHGGSRETELSSLVRWIRIIPETISEDTSNAFSGFLIENTHVKSKSKSKFSANREFPKSRRNSLQHGINKFYIKTKEGIKNSSLVGKKANKAWSILLVAKNFVDVYRIISTAKPEFVITFLYHDTLVIGLSTLLRRNPPKLIVGRRSPFGYTENRSRAQKIVMRWVYRRASAAVTNSLVNVPNALADGIAEEKISQIENFVDSNSNKYMQANEDQLTLICVANFFDYKNHFNLIKAISKFNGTVKVKFLGEGPLKEDAMNLAKDLGVNSIFYGHEEQKKIATHAMDFFVLPSEFEGNSNALLEAILEGFPAITTPVGNASQLRKTGAPVIVTSGFDVKDLEKAIQIALVDKDNYVNIAKAHMHTIAEAHSKRAIFNQWADLLGNLSASPKGK